MRSPLRTALCVAVFSVLVGAAPSTASPLPLRGERTAGEIARVVVISVDGLTPRAITLLGKTNAPTFHRLVAEGATTFNARSEVELTLTLPNHTSMVTSRRVDRARGGHGVTWNDERLKPRTVQTAAGRQVGSVFSSLKSAGLSSALFAAKPKFTLFNRSWPESIDHTLIRADNTELVKAAQRDLATTWRALTFLHISLPDVAGHEHGWMSPEYRKAVRQSDYLVGRVLGTISATAESLDHTLVIVTADHGGIGPSHSERRKLANYRVPFLACGPGVPAGVDLYDLNPTYADPGRLRVGYGKALQPIRNGDVGNLVLDVLGLPAIPHSELDYDQDLEVFADAG
jgi:hypothetical protein